MYREISRKQGFELSGKTAKEIIDWLTGLSEQNGVGLDRLTVDIKPFYDYDDDIGVEITVEHYEADTPKAEADVTANRPAWASNTMQHPSNVSELGSGSGAAHIVWPPAPMAGVYDGHGVLRLAFW